MLPEIIGNFDIQIKNELINVKTGAFSSQQGDFFMKIADCHGGGCRSVLHTAHTVSHQKIHFFICQGKPSIHSEIFVECTDLIPHCINNKIILIFTSASDGCPCTDQ